VAQALGVVHVLISSKAAEHRLPQQTDQRTAAVSAGSRISEYLARHLGQAECIVEFAVCQQSQIGPSGLTDLALAGGCAMNSVTEKLGNFSKRSPAQICV
jgi:hypothetical protein